MQSASDRNQYQTSFVPADLVSEFKAPQDSILSRVTQYLPPVTANPTIHKSQVSSDMMFQIPDSLGAIDTKTMRLHLDVEVTLAAGTYPQGWVKLDNAGAGTMINNVTLSSGGMNIEQVSYVGSLVGILNANCPEDYQEGVLSITEKVQYYEPLDRLTPAVVAGTLCNTTKHHRGPYGYPGGKKIIQVVASATANELGDFSTGIVTTTNLSYRFTTAINLPLGFFNTNRPIHTHLMGGMRLNIAFNPYLYFLVFSPIAAAGTAAATVSALTGTAKVNPITDAINVSIRNAELRYDLLTLSQEFLGMMKQSIRELGSFEYPYNSYRVSVNTLSASVGEQVVKVSGTSGSVLSDITFGIIPYSEAEPLINSQSFYAASGLDSYYFQIGGARVPNRPIQTFELTTANGPDTYATNMSVVVGGVAAGSMIASDLESDGFVEMLKSMNIFKTYSVGVKQSSSKLINSPYALQSLGGNSTDEFTADALDHFRGASRIFSYSFTQSYDAEVVSGFTLADNSEISLVLNFRTEPTPGSRIVVALNYQQKYITSSSGQSYVQL